MSKPLRVVALVLAALSLTMTSAHVLELPQKMRYVPAFYGEVNGSLYRWFAVIGGIYTVAAIALAWAFAWSSRANRAVFRWACAGAGLLTLAFVSWLVLVVPVNATIGRVTRDAPASVAAWWSELRPRWEYGHLVGFVLQLLGFASLALAAVADVPGAARRAVHTSDPFGGGGCPDAMSAPSTGSDGAYSPGRLEGNKEGSGPAARPTKLSNSRWQ
jgi:hypothetical protein